MRTFDIPNAPAEELNRSTAAYRVGELAEESGLLLAHFEHRHHWTIPDEWAPNDRPDLTAGPTWQSGIFVEHKYRHFRYDNPIGSYHPNHRAKWTAHELCHALIGFAWRADATPFFHTLSARLCEVLPVALWYFFDEVDLNRCPIHAAGGALFDAHCAACEQAAKQPKHTPATRPDLWVKGREFVMAELAAIARSRRLGQPVPHRYATLDLNSDAIAWTAANRHRLASHEFEWFRSLFLGPEQGCFAHLDDMEARVIEVLNALDGTAPAQPLKGGRNLWIAQDIAWRLMMVSLECDGEVVDELRHLIEGLASAPTHESIHATYAAYGELFETWYLPDREDVFALGYPIDSFPSSSARQLEAGLEQTLPNTLAALGDDGPAITASFIAEDPVERTPIARRFSRFLTTQAQPIAAAISRYECALAHPQPADTVVDALVEDQPRSNGTFETANGVEILEEAFDVVAVVEDPEALKGPIKPSPTHLVARRTASGEVVLAEVSAHAARTLKSLRQTPAPLSEIQLSTLEIESLLRLGLLKPTRWLLECPSK
ncbi:MAG: hypothetical protein VX589_06520 [Myxococcota bacterium]|nr:hypothetical protein [Myxococcota bacterium]